MTRVQQLVISQKNVLLGVAFKRKLVLFIGFKCIY